MADFGTETTVRIDSNLNLQSYNCIKSQI